MHPRVHPPTQNNTLIATIQGIANKNRHHEYPIQPTEFYETKNTIENLEKKYYLTPTTEITAIEERLIAFIQVLGQMQRKSSTRNKIR